MRHILVIANDKTEQEMISRILAEAGYRLTMVSNEVEAIHMLRLNPGFDLVLGEFTAAAILEKMVETYPQIAIVVGFNTQEILRKTSTPIAGVFSYPIEPSTLLPVIQEVLTMPSKPRANEPNSVPELVSAALKVRDLNIDLHGIKVQFQNKALDLTPTEFEILYLLAKNAGRVISLEEIVFQLQHTRTNRDDARKMLSAHMSNLRSKLRDVGAEGYLINVRGRGYLIDVHEALRRSEIQLQLFVEQLPVVLWTTDAQLQITSCLGAGLKTLGLEPDDLLGMTLYEYLQTNEPQHPLIVAHRAALEGTSTALEGEGVRQGYYSTYVESLVDEQGSIIGCVGIALDITPHVQAKNALQDSQQRLTAIFDNTQEMLLLVDNQHRLQDANPAAAKLLGYSREELLSRSLFELIAETSPTDANKLWADLLEHGEQRGKLTLRKKRWHSGLYRLPRAGKYHTGTLFIYH
ncbi:MAG TPA: PAS domain S-box protein, partial [Phototrophicaceae bacterium]|nr:PAS domain S-box protein [Phototrophicaceae bacterium]